MSLSIVGNTFEKTAVSLRAAVFLSLFGLLVFVWPAGASASESSPIQGDTFQKLSPESTTEATTFLAQVVDENGILVGVRQISDWSQCGSDLGPRIIKEGAAPEGHLRLLCLSQFQMNSLTKADWPGAEVKTLVNQGPTANRIDLTIISDGYTSNDKSKFFADADRITKELFGASTFQTYLPLFNVHAVYVPSQESGIGDGSPKNTALGLYRDPQVRQAVMCGNPSAARQAARLAPAADYIIIVGNDSTYGGLGGEFAITTSAPLNITTVLRHELGHNFGKVGEEYDGGFVYSGANFSSGARVSWDHWVDHSKLGPAPMYQMDLIDFSAPWKNLQNSGWQKTIRIPSNDNQLFIDFNGLGFDTPSDVDLFVDGQKIPYTGDFNYDRNFYQVYVPVAPNSSHSVEFREAIHDGNNVLSKVGLYALNQTFPAQSKDVAAFATYNSDNDLVGYRPTLSTCLMRNMKSHDFCSVCIENMWHRFLSQVSLIDGIEINGNHVTAHLIPLGNQRLRITWIDPSGHERSEYQDQASLDIPKGQSGNWKLKVTLQNANEIKSPDRDQWLTHQKNFSIP